MISDNNPPSGTHEWDSDEIAFANFSCDQAARFLGAFTSAFRALAIANDPHQQTATLRQLLATQQALFQSGALSEEDTKFAEKSIPVGLTAIGMAIVAVNAGCDPRHILALASSGFKAMEKLSATIDASKNHFDFHVRKGEDENLEIAITPMSMEELEGKAALTEMGKAIKQAATPQGPADI